MSTSSYTRVENTTVSGSELLGSLSGDDVRALNFQAALSRNDPIVLTNANYTLTTADIVQATAGIQMIDATGLSAADRALVVGPDADSTAGYYIDLFNLSSGEQNKVVMNFDLSGGDLTADGDVLFQNSSGSDTNVNINLDGGADGNSVIMYDTTVTYGAGSHRVVEVWATNVTSGSRVVNFNVGTCLQPANA